MKISQDQLAELQPHIISLAQVAGEAILAIYDTNFSVTHKQDQSPVTDADIAAHRIIAEGLQRLTPDLPILSEEAADISFTIREQWSSYWLVDPLDGTREFIKRNGEFTVNIALINQHKTVLGVVYAPCLKQLYYANVQTGAYTQIGDNQPKQIQVRPLSSIPIAVAGSRSHSGSRLSKYLHRLGEHTLVSMGSSLKICLVAEGRADLYPRLGPTSEWDTAAAQCVLERAGGYLTDTTMQPLRYNTKSSLLNPYFFAFGDQKVNWSQFL